MCNACGFLCCAWDGFGKCGCDHCPEYACHSVCGGCGAPEDFCECDPDDDYYDEDPAPADENPQSSGTAQATSHD
jgi:hypothetical protein